MSNAAWGIMMLIILIVDRGRSISTRAKEAS